MPADAWAVQFPVGKCSPAAKSGELAEQDERVSGTRQSLTKTSSRENSAGWGNVTRDHMAVQSRIDDTLLVREAQRGSRAAFEELVRHYDQAVLRLALHLTGSDHEAQEIGRA